MKTVLALIALSISVSAGEFRAAAARADIAPQIPVQLGGYASRTNLSLGIHDPLSARAMAFEQDGKRLLLISLDNLGFYNDTAEPLRKAILDECKLQPDELFLAAIHTHSAPILTLNTEKGHSNNIAYTRDLQQKLSALSKKTLDQLAPAQLSLGLGSSPVGVNRREVVPDTNGATKIVLGRNPYLPIDREVQVLKITRPNSTDPVGLLFAYAVHSTSLGPRNYLVSGDIHGLAAQFVEKYFGNIVAPEFAGASGNIDPWYRVLPTFNTTNNWIPEPILLGTMLGEEVIHTANRTTPLTNLTIKTSIKTLQLPGRTRGQPAPSTTETTTTSLAVTVAAVGDIAFVGLGGEMFTEIGQTIKKASPFKHTIVITHCNGAAGYLPIASAYPEGGYEVQSSAFAPGADQQLAREVQSMLTQLRPN